MIGDILNKTRKSQGLTAQQMADYLSINLRSYRAYESNDRQPSLQMLIKIANKLNVTTDYLLNRTHELNSGNEI
ncbi:MAG: helix-turn-helix domain-containing protein [Defluviitaleaceae bacterium]|nr:helix-turn-helix domain-containing protein [Defluviitaleaceae bacterium]